MWTKNEPQARSHKIALHLQHPPVKGRIKLAINGMVVSEEEFEDRNQRKMIMLNWEEKYSLFEKKYCLTIAG
jgi:hypothetical protein